MADDEPRLPCGPIPDDRVTKTIGLAPCRHCGDRGCFRAYLEWEKRAGITLNADLHLLVDVDDNSLPQIICEHCLVRVEPLWTRREITRCTTLMHLRCHGVERLVEISDWSGRPGSFTWDQLVDPNDLSGMEQHLEERMLADAELLEVVRSVLRHS